ncbi:MAG: amidohydrolase family protein [Pirellula sp.]|jgi:imidazolonepropionase-like amidohydrolase
MELDRRRLLQMGSSSIACMAVGDLCSRRSRAEGLAGETTAWLDAKILLGESQAGTAVLDRGTLVIRGSKIIAVGRTGEVAIPEGTKTIDAGGQWIMPGLVCTHSHIGGGGAADGSSPIQPGVRILDSINVRDSGFKRALAGGLTTLNIMPGSGHLVSGQTVYCKLRYAGKGPTTIDDILIRDDQGKSLGGLKMANGTNSQGDSPFPGTRGKSAFLVREQYIKAREYHAKVVAAKEDPEKRPPRDLHLESLVEAMQGTRIVHHHTHRHDDIITVLRLAQEFNLRVVLHHVSEGWKVADEIAAAKVPCSIIVLDSPGGKLEARDMALKNGRVLSKAGVRVAFHTDDWITDSRLFARSAALAVRAGMDRDQAVSALTLAGAEMLGLESRIGSLSPGKDADFAILSGDPLSVYSRVLQTWVEGEKAFDLSDPGDALFAEGGQGAGSDLDPFLCCYAQAWQVGGSK